MFQGDWQYVTSVHKLQDLPVADRSEIAFVGRSNVGKSSLLNALTKKRGLAKTSSTPGRTQALNFFELCGDEKFYLVDLPGYGYAKAPLSLVTRWQELLKDYLRGRPTLHKVFLLVDSRHGLKKNDLDIMTMLDESAVPYQVVLTKVDKIKSGALAMLTQSTETALKTRPAAFPDVIATSSEKNIGIDDIKKIVYKVYKSCTSE